MPTPSLLTLTTPLPRTKPPLASTTAKQPAHTVLAAGARSPLVAGAELRAAAPEAAIAIPEASIVPSATTTAAHPRIPDTITAFPLDGEAGQCRFTARLKLEHKLVREAMEFVITVA